MRACKRESTMGRKMEWAGRGSHMGGVPRKMVFMGVGAFAKAVSNLLNTSSVYNADTLIRLVRSRPPGVPLITVGNHMSTLDDPVMWGFRGFPSFNSKLARWVLAAEDICFKNPLLSYFFRLGKCIPITRGAGIYQEHMNEALEHLSNGAWVMPENYWFGRRAPFPICNKRINIVVGEPMEFDLSKMRQTAISMSRNLPFPSKGWPSISHYDLDEAAQRCLYMAISKKIQIVMESLRCLGKSFFK